MDIVEADVLSAEFMSGMICRDGHAMGGRPYHASIFLPAVEGMLLSLGSPSSPASQAAAVRKPRIVLAHPRTGSSLLMQTLAILGMPWLGNRHRSDLGTAANPKGYFEDPDMLAHGLTAEQIARTGPVDGCAVKIGLSNMMLPTRLAQWTAWEAGDARIFVPFRHPLESAVSLRCFNPQMAERREFFIETTRFLYNYAQDYATLAMILTRHAPGLKARTALVPYDHHLDDPQGFVVGVCRHAGLSEDTTRQEQAVENIERDLYRVKLSDMPVEYQDWYERAPARQVYEMLCGSADPWADITAWAASRASTDEAG